MSIPRDDVWKLGADGRIAWRQWDGDYVVFNPASGDTHLLDIASGEVLVALRGGRASTEELAAHLADLLEIGTGDTVTSATEHILATLTRLGLVDPAA
jgi:PqqD family protein of HPr-rel-A system